MFVLLKIFAPVPRLLPPPDHPNPGGVFHQRSPRYLPAHHHQRFVSAGGWHSA